MNITPKRTKSPNSNLLIIKMLTFSSFFIGAAVKNCFAAPMADLHFIFISKYKAEGTEITNISLGPGHYFFSPK